MSLIPVGSGDGFRHTRHYAKFSLAFLAASALVLAATSGASQQENAGSQLLLWGDSECDGSVNAIDAALTLQYVAGLFDGEQTACPNLGQSLPIVVESATEVIQYGDVDCDGTINTIDAALLLQYVAALFDGQTNSCATIGASVPIPVMSVS